MQAGSVFVKIGADMKDFNASIDKMTSKMQGVGKKMESIGKSMTTKLTLPIAALGGVMVNSAMQFEATSAKYETVFGEMTEQADMFIAKFRELTPATTAEARTMASSVQDLLVPMGFMRSEATQMTGEFMHVIGALTNFNSATHTAEDVTTAVSAAITGEYEGLKRLGVQLDVTTVKEKAVRMGLARTTDEVTKQHQAQVLLSEIYKQSGDALNAYTEQNLDTKTKMALLRKESAEVARQFGEILLPSVLELVESLKGLLEWFSGLSDGTKKIIVGVLAVVAAIGPLLLIFGKVALAINSITTLVGGAGGMAAIFTALTGPIGLVIAAIVAAIAIGVFLYKNWDRLKADAKKLWDSIVETFTGIKEAITTKISDAIQSVKDKFQEIVDFFSNLDEKFVEAGKKIVESIAEGIKDKFMEPIEAIKDLVGKIRDHLPFSPAKVGPLRDLNKLDFGGPIEDSIKADVGRVQGQMEHMLAMPAGVGGSGGGSASIYVELDGRTIGKAVGKPLVDEIRVKTGMRI